MKIAVAGTGYVGLVTGVCLAEIGHHVICVDIDTEKISSLVNGISPIYEPGIEELIKKNVKSGRLHFTTNCIEAYSEVDVIYIAVGTPENVDGSANLTFVMEAASEIASALNNDCIVVTKSTVPVGTNEKINELIQQCKPPHVNVTVVSNPEFLREGSAIYDMFNGDRIVIGADCEAAANIIEQINKPFCIPIIKTDIATAEMIKYAANAYLATKISFINEIANICEKVGANIEDVARGIGQDKRIGSAFLQAGIGYGGSCFPKDTKALVQLAGNIEHDFELLDAVIRVNNEQQALLVKKALCYIGSLNGKDVAVLGLAFKPNTDDVREAASIATIKQLLAEGACVTAYDPIAIPNTKRYFPELNVTYTTSIEQAITRKDAVFIVTEWETIKMLPLTIYKEKMKEAIVFDGRNCYELQDAINSGISYFSIGRKMIEGHTISTQINK